jgi:hypothetical protein
VTGVPDSNVFVGCKTACLPCFGLFSTEPAPEVPARFQELLDVGFAAERTGPARAVAGCAGAQTMTAALAAGKRSMDWGLGGTR